MISSNGILNTLASGSMAFEKGLAVHAFSAMRR